ncbi:hypothetical protein ABIA58_005438 [Pseudomonas frederiksbergensis]
MTLTPGVSEAMKRSPLFTLLSGFWIAAAMILTATLVAWIGSSALGSFEVWQQAFESVRPYLRWWRALLYGTLFALWWDLLRRYRHRQQDRLRVKRIGTLGLALLTVVEFTRL